MKQNNARVALRAEAARLQALFEEAGAITIEAESLLPAETLLDLYGEAIRGRAYVTHDPVTGEKMMRPDFTVPVVEQHMAEGAEPARYTYNGPVWRMQEAGLGRPTEYTQVGFEIFDREDPAGADAEVFALFQSILPDSAEVVTGDIGLLRAAVMDLDTHDRRKAALMRHIWRPAKFASLLQRYSSDVAMSENRAALIDSAQKDRDVTKGRDVIGLRTAQEINARAKWIAQEAAMPRLNAQQVDLLDQLQVLEGGLSKTLSALQALDAGPLLAAAIARFARRLDALDSRGVDVARTKFVGRYGLTSMEYYDGFVFGFSIGNTTVASGGRYDALTAAMGGGRSIPAVGGVIRPDILLEAAS